MASGRIRPRILLKGVALLVSLALLGWLAEWLVETGVLSKRFVDTAVAGHGLSGYLTFLGIGALATALGFPRQVVAFLGGHAFGVVLGTSLALAATVAGCAATFTYARVFARSIVARRFAGRVRQFDEFLGLHPFQMTMIVRLLPVGNNALTGMLAGVSRVRVAPFLAGSAVGYLPQTVAFALAGGGTTLAPALEIALAAALFVASALLGISLYRKHRHGAGLEASIDEALESSGGPQGDAR